MKENTNESEKVIETGDSSGPENAERLTPEQKKTIFRLADHIDEHGRYADALKPMALGFAAGRGISEHEAKQEIDGLFKRELGKDLKSYLEKYRIDRGMSVDSGRSRS